MLTPLQERVARIVSALPEADGFALAGGAALVVSRVVDRTTKDLDFFGPSADDVQHLVEALDAALTQAGLTVHRERVSETFARLTVTTDDDATEVDLAADARMRPTETGPLGPMLSLEELAATSSSRCSTGRKHATSSMSRRDTESPWRAALDLAHSTATMHLCATCNDTS